MAARRPIQDIDWQAVTIGIVPQTISEFYLISYLRREGLLESLYPNNLRLVRSSPVGVANAFIAGEIDVAVVWEPLATLIRDEAPTASASLQDPGLYEQQIYLLTSATAYRERRDALDAMRLAFEDACNYIESNRTAAARHLEQLFDYPSGALEQSTSWRETSFEFSRDRNRIWPTILEDFELARLSGVAQVGDPSHLEQCLDYLD